jgi:ketosteroid isomerase-like protein
MNGSVASREDDIAMFKEGLIKPDFIRHEDLKLSFYGDVALVTGIENVGGTAFGQRGEFSLRFANVLVQRDGRWQLVLHQSTAIPRQVGEPAE